MQFCYSGRCDGGSFTRSFVMRRTCEASRVGNANGA